MRTKAVEPGYCPDTRFADNGAERMQAHAPFAGKVFAGFSQLDATTRPDDVAAAVWQAANDTSSRLRFAACADALALAKDRGLT